MKKSRGLSLGLVLGGENEIRTRGRDCSLRRFSKPVVSATHPSLLMTAFVLHIAATLSRLPARHVRPAACGKTSVAGLWVQSYECFPVPPNFTPRVFLRPFIFRVFTRRKRPPKGGKGRPAVFSGDCRGGKIWPIGKLDLILCRITGYGTDPAKRLRPAGPAASRPDKNAI